MKYVITILALSFLGLGQANAQDEKLEGSKREKLQALKVGYLTEKLALTPEEAQAFWPLYNEMEARIKETRKARRKNRRNTMQNHEEMSDQDLLKALDSELTMEQQELDLKKEYSVRFREILPIKKVVKLHALEETFKKELLRKARDRRRGQPREMKP